MNPPPAVSLRGFGVAFGPQVVLASVDLELPRAGMTVLVGPAASGKSTLLRTVAGLNDAHPSLRTWGRAEIMGEPLPAPGTRSGCARDPRIGYVMQHARFFMDSVRENLLSALPDRGRLAGPMRTEAVREILVANGLGELGDRLDAEVISLPASLQRRLAVARAVAADPGVLLADEVTASLADRDALAVMEVLRLQAGRRSVLVVTHNQAHARAAGGNTALLAEGRIQETAPTAEFFASPRSEVARRFVRTGGYARPASPLDEAAAGRSAPAADARGAPAEEVRRPVPGAAGTPSRFAGPRGFFWALPGKLAGVPRPGIVAELKEDLEGLARLGVGVLVTLEETRTVDPAALRAFDVSQIHFPIPDQGVPAVDAALELCREVDELLGRGRAVAFHCRAGLGRTGTMLACQLVRMGAGAAAAVERVRQLNHRCIQTDEQAQFVKQFEEALTRRNGSGRAPRDARGGG